MDGGGDESFERKGTGPVEIRTTVRREVHCVQPSGKSGCTVCAVFGCSLEQREGNKVRRLRALLCDQREGGVMRFPAGCFSTVACLAWRISPLSVLFDTAARPFSPASCILCGLSRHPIVRIDR